jgi:hypothetical protein
MHEILAHPKRVLTVSIPIRMDNGEVKVLLVLDHSIMTPVALLKGVLDITRK